MQRRKERYIPNDFEISDDHQITPYTPADKIVEIIVERMLDVVRQQLNIPKSKPLGDANQSTAKKQSA